MTTFRNGIATRRPTRWWICLCQIIISKYECLWFIAETPPVKCITTTITAANFVNIFLILDIWFHHDKIIWNSIHLSGKQQSSSHRTEFIFSNIPWVGREIYFRPGTVLTKVNMVKIVKINKPFRLKTTDSYFYQLEIYFQYFAWNISPSTHILNLSKHDISGLVNPNC